MIKADLYGALSRGYCSKKNSSKTVDPDLIEAMADEILLLYRQKKGDFMGTENQIQECKCEDKSTNYHLTVCEKGMKNDEGTLNKSDFYKEIESVINRYSKENESNTPDWVLAEYLERSLEIFNACINLRERYYGREK